MSGPSRAADAAARGVDDDLPRRLERRLQSLLPEGVRPAWVVAFSGGVDSVALLSALHATWAAGPARARAPLRAIHVDHGLHPDAPRWAAHCRRLCRELGVPLTVRRARLVPARGESIEAAAREARYALLRDALRRDELLLTAHHLDDQLETLLLQLMRGAGVAGLAAMPGRARFGRGWLLRPLLALERAELEAWVRARGLEWVDDDSNADERFDRNYLRRRVVPALKARWSAAARVAARSAAHLADARAVLEEVAAADVAAAAAGRALRVAALQALPIARRRNAVRGWILAQGLPVPDTRHLARILGELCDARRDSNPCVAWPGAEARRHRGLLYALAATAAPPPRAVLRWDWRRARVLPLGAGLGSLVLRRDRHGPIDGRRLPARLQVRWRDGGERLRTEREGPRRALKEVLRAHGVLPWMRARLPLVQAGDALVAVADLWVDAAFAVDGTSRSRYRLEWRDAPPCVADAAPAQPAGTSATPDRQ